jgi:hypothetical protein
MDNQKHEYTNQPKVTKIRTRSAKQRTYEDENTRKYYVDDNGKRSTADVGGQQLARGLEHKALYEIQTQGELQDFINVLKILEQHPLVSLIRVIIDVLPEVKGERKFIYLNDGVSRRKNVIAEVYLTSGKVFNIIEVERESRSLSTLILSSSLIENLQPIYKRLLVNLVNNSGTWTSKSMRSIEERGVTILKIKHSNKGINHRAQVLLNKLL